MSSNEKKIIELTKEEAYKVCLCIKYVSKDFEMKWLANENDYDAMNSMYLCDELAKKFE